MSIKKENLLKTAELLFYKYGFRGVGLKQIISEANVATMTLYNHFESKDHLVEEVLKNGKSAIGPTWILLLIQILTPHL